MNLKSKEQIQILTEHYCRKFESQAKAASSLKDISEATLIAVRKGRWDNISDEMWRNLAKQVGYDDKKTILVETMNFQTCLLYYGIAQDEGEMFALVEKAGGGKSYAGKWYRDQHRGKNVFYLQCAEYWSKKYFLMELLEAMGRNPNGMNVFEMMKDIISELRKMDKPLIIVDEVDKLNDNTLLFFITIYNELHGLTGIVWTSTDAIVKRFNAAVRKNKIGFNELFSRIGRKFVQLPGLTDDEIREIAIANGMANEQEIYEAINTSEKDLRRVGRISLQKRLINRSNNA